MLLRKLHNYVFGGNLLNMARIVPVQSIPASPLPVTSGVPQCVLFPLPDVVRSSQIAAFADDTKVFKEIISTSDAEQL